MKTLFLFALACFSTLSFAQSVQRLPCKDVSLPLFYEAYGIKLREKDNWECEAVISAKESSPNLIVWEKPGNDRFLPRRVIFGESALKEVLDSMVEGKPLEDLLRQFSLSFLADEKEESEWIRDSFHLYRGGAKGILFGKENEKVAVYDIDEEEFVGPLNTHAYIYKKEGDRYLSVSCTGCTLPEFLSEIILPAIRGLNEK